MIGRRLVLALHFIALPFDVGRQAAKVRSGITGGEQAGVRGTPTFFVGFTEPNSANLKAVRRIIGAQPYAAFKAAIDDLLSAQ